MNRDRICDKVFLKISTYPKTEIEGWRLIADHCNAYASGNVDTGRNIIRHYDAHLLYDNKPQLVGFSGVQ